MRGKSHICLGQYLVRQYMSDLPRRYIRAFLVGCIEPDRNPVTYFKGSVRHQWLRGHNFLNARRFMHRISRRLERKETLTLFDYYTLGKLIHYTADAFTYAHNASFPDKLSDHREYENKLQAYFLDYLHSDPHVDIQLAQSIMDGILNYHLEYEETDSCVSSDCKYALKACCCVLAILLVPRII